MLRSKQPLRRSHWVAIAAMLCALCGTAITRAADIHGQLLLGAYHPPAPPKPARPAFNWELDNGVKEIARDRISASRELAVVLVGSAEPKLPDRVEVPVSGGSLLPATVVVRTGSTVRIRNDDEIGHELYAEGLDGFSAEATSPRAVRSIHLTKPGGWPLRDKLAPHAQAYLHVLSDLVAVAKVDPSGSYIFSDVAAGKYTLKVFHGPNTVATKEIEVSDRALALDPLTLEAAPLPTPSP